MLKISAFD